MSKIKETFSRIRDFFSGFFDIPSLEMSPEREDAVLNKIATAVSRYGMELPALFMGGAFVPISTIVSYTVLVPAAPFFELVGIDGYEVAAFFKKKDNVKRLMAKIEELQYAREEAGRKRKSNGASDT